MNVRYLQSVFECYRNIFANKCEVSLKHNNIDN